MPNPALAGSIFDSAGIAVSGVTVNVYQAGDTATVIATTTTGADGAWSVANSSVQNPDIELVNGTEISRFKYADKIAFTQADVQTQVWRNDSATSSFSITTTAATLTKDQTFTLPALGADASAGQFLVGGTEQFITASNAAVGGFPVTLVKTADETVADSALTNDTHLQFALSSATTYKVEAHYNATFGNAGRPAFSWSVPSGANLVGQWFTNAATTAAPIAARVTEASTYGPALATSPTAHWFSGYVISSATAGNLIPQVRQEAADATVTTFTAGSWMTVTRISS